MGMTIADLIRSMSDEDLAQLMIDIAYENTPLEDSESYMRIPSPLGGYLVDGVTVLHDTDIVVDALQEEVDNGNGLAPIADYEDFNNREDNDET